MVFGPLFTTSSKNKFLLCCLTEQNLQDLSKREENLFLFLFFLSCLFWAYIILRWQYNNIVHCHFLSQQQATYNERIIFNLNVNMEESHHCNILIKRQNLSFDKFEIFLR